MNQVFQAYRSTASLGKARKVFSVDRTYYFQFPYRGGFVTYEPKEGANWRKSAPDPYHTDWVDDKSIPPSDKLLTNGCLVFACEKAELIRRGGLPGASRSQVIGYERTNKTRHAIVIYDLDGRTVAEDERGQRVFVSPWMNRTPAEALAIAKEFSGAMLLARFNVLNFNVPKSANFLGEY